VIALTALTVCSGQSKTGEAGSLGLVFVDSPLCTVLCWKNIHFNHVLFQHIVGMQLPNILSTEIFDNQTINSLQI
jgi:hypothetical protein